MKKGIIKNRKIKIKIGKNKLMKMDKQIKEIKRKKYIKEKK